MLNEILRRIQHFRTSEDEIPAEDSFERVIFDYIEDAVSLLVQDNVEADSSSNNPLIIAAVECYVKMQIDYDGKAEWYERQWDKRKTRLMLDSDYSSEVV